MNDEGKIGAARDGASAFVASLGDKDEMALMTFNAKPSWALPLGSVGPARDRLTGTIGGLFAQGGTSLYDAVAEAYDSIARTPAGSKISALVVLSDGRGSRHRMGLSELLQKIRFDSEGAGIRVFTIGYGSDAKADVLEKIADECPRRHLPAESPATVPRPAPSPWRRLTPSVASQQRAGRPLGRLCPCDRTIGSSTHARMRLRPPMLERSRSPGVPDRTYHRARRRVRYGTPSFPNDAIRS